MKASDKAALELFFCSRESSEIENNHQKLCGWGRYTVFGEWENNLHALLLWLQLLGDDPDVTNEIRIMTTKIKNWLRGASSNEKGILFWNRICLIGRKGVGNQSN